MTRLVSATLATFGLLGMATAAQAGWDDSYRYCPGAWGCPSAYYSLPPHRSIYEYRYLLQHNGNLTARRALRRSRTHIKPGHR